MEHAQISCPKCGYTRQPGDTAPTDECPKCGIIYAKATLGPRPSGPSVPPTWRNEPPPAPAEAVQESLAALPQKWETSTATGKQLIDCAACGALMSHLAQTCPRCGHPNPDAPRTAGLIAGVIAISLGIDAALMPYFAAAFLVPAAFAAAAVTAILRMRTLAIIAAILASIGLYEIYQTSKELREIQKNAERSQSQLRQEVERLQLDAERKLRGLAR